MKNCGQCAKPRRLDGESFAQLITNPKLENDVKLDLIPIECDMVEGFYVSKDDEIDGIKFDSYHNPIAYRILKSHPGDYRNITSYKTAGDWINRKFILHYFTAESRASARSFGACSTSQPVWSDEGLYCGGD